MEVTTVKSTGEYVGGLIKLTAKARVWYNVKRGYVLVIKDGGFVDKFRELGGDRKRVLIEVDTPVARFTYAGFGDIVRRERRGRVREFVKFHCVRDLDESWKALYWFGDFTVNVYIPVMKNVRGGL